MTSHSRCERILPRATQNANMEHRVLAEEFRIRSFCGLVYFVCSRTRSPRLWDVNCGNSCIKSPGCI